MPGAPWEGSKIPLKGPSRDPYAQEYQAIPLLSSSSCYCLVLEPSAEGSPQRREEAKQQSCLCHWVGTRRTKYASLSLLVGFWGQNLRGLRSSGRRRRSCYSCHCRSECWQTEGARYSISHQPGGRNSSNIHPLDHFSILYPGELSCP